MTDDEFRKVVESLRQTRSAPRVRELLQSVIDDFRLTDRAEIAAIHERLAHLEQWGWGHTRGPGN